MEKRITAYRKYIDRLLETEDADWETVRKEHLVQMGFFQHERLIHLIVTVAFAVLEMLAISMTLVSYTPVLVILAIFLLILLIPYIRHYYILENEVQKMYAQYDKMLEKTGGLCGKY